MKNIFLIIFLSSLLFADIKSLAPNLQNFINKHKTIVLGTSSEWDPYVIVNQDGTISGYDNDILKLVNKYTGANFVLKVGIWSDIQQEAKDKKIDGLATLTQNFQRDKWLDFSTSYIAITKNIITNFTSHMDEINSLDELKGKTIVLQRANTLDESLAKKLGMNTVYMQTMKDVYKSVLDGRYPFTFGNSTTEYQLGKMGLPQLNVIYKFKDTIELKFATRKDIPEAIEILNLGLSKISYEEFQSLEKKWFLKNSTFTGGFLSEKERQYLKSKEEITICSKKDFAPFYFTQRDKDKGVLVDVIEILQKEIGSKFRFVKSNCDISQSVIELDEVSTNYTKPYFEQSLVVVTKDTQPFMEDIKNKHYKVCVVDGFGYEDILQNRYPNIEILKVKDVSEAFRYVKSSKVFGYIDLFGVVGYHLQQLNNTKLKISAKLDIDIALVFKTKDKLLKDILDKTLINIDKKKIKNIYYKWVDIEIKQVIDFRFLKEVLLFVFLFILVSLYWFRKLSIAKKKIEYINKNLEIRIQEEIQKTQKKDIILMQQNRLAQMGEMISMIAHQWRQPLNMISLNVSSLKMKAKSNKLDNDLVIKSIDDTIKTIGYLSNTIDDFRDFFKPTKMKQEITLNLILEDVINLINSSLQNSKVTIIKELDSKKSFFSYKNELMQVVINLIKNAQDILEEKQIKDRYIKLKTYDIDGYVVLEVIDNGGGIDDNIIDKIFDPYFSTKSNQHGTGLGLYMSKIIVEKHCSGKLGVYNADNGAVFKIMLDADNG